METSNKIHPSFKENDAKPLKMVDFGNKNERLTFTYQDMKDAESQSYSKGFSEGTELGVSHGELKAKREFDANIKEILLQIEHNLIEIVADQKVFLENFFPNVLRICLAVLQKSMPYFFEKSGKQEMENILRNVIESLIFVVPIKVKVSESSCENLSKHIQSISSVYPETIEIIKSADLADGACEVEWAGGAAKWNLDSRYQEIEAKLLEHLKMDLTEGEQHG